jgi:small subunit ribosomal protein S20
MPNKVSAAKRDRQNVTRNTINRRNRSRLRTQIKKMRAALKENAVEQLKGLLPETFSVIDKSVHKGIIHRNTAARYKSRLANHVSAALAKVA